MVSSQAPESVRQLVKEYVKNLPGPKGDEENELYVISMINQCDAIAMFDYEGTLLYAWSQDEMNIWYWFADYDAASGKSKCSYVYTQSDNSTIYIPSESEIVAKFIQNNSSFLFFNGCKFYLTQKEVAEDGITYAVLGGVDGRGLHAAISPDKSYMIVVSASTSAKPTEYYFGIESNRKELYTKRALREISTEFRLFAAGALGV